MTIGERTVLIQRLRDALHWWEIELRVARARHSNPEIVVIEASVEALRMALEASPSASAEAPPFRGILQAWFDKYELQSDRWPCWECGRSNADAELRIVRIIHEDGGEVETGCTRCNMLALLDLTRQALSASEAPAEPPASERARLEQERDEVLTACKDLKAENQTLRNVAVNAAERAETAEEALAEAEQTIATLRADKARLKKQIEVLEAMLTPHTERDLVRQVTELQTRLGNAIHEAEQTIATLRAQQEAAVWRIEQLERIVPSELRADDQACRNAEYVQLHDVLAALARPSDAPTP